MSSTAGSAHSGAVHHRSPGGFLSQGNTRLVEGDAKEPSALATAAGETWSGSEQPWPHPDLQKASLVSAVKRVCQSGHGSAADMAFCTEGLAKEGTSSKENHYTG